MQKIKEETILKKTIGALMCFLLLVGCNTEETIDGTTEVNTSEVKQEEKLNDFDAEAFLKEAESQSFEWYIAESAKLTPEEMKKLEDYQAKQEAEKMEGYQSILDNADINEVINAEGQKVIEYTMVNSLDNDVEFFQLQWMEDSVENVSATADNIKVGQEFTLVVDPAFDKTLDNVDLNTLRLTGS